MPSYLDFDSTKRFRDYILGKTLQKPDGPQTFTSTYYSVQNLSDTANMEVGTVEDNRTEMLQYPQTNNVFKPLEFNVTENINTIPRKSNLSLYPYFELQNHNLISIYNQQNLDGESELIKFAGRYLTSTNGPVYSRIAQNIERETTGRVRLIDALNGNVATASNIVTGREPLIAPNYQITVANSLPGKVIDFVQVASGVEFPWTEIPGDYLTDPKNPINVRPVPNTELGKVFQDVTGALGSLIGIKRRPSPSRKPSDLLIEYMGQGQKNTLYDLLSYSTYAPNYTTTARSQNTSKVFNFIDNVAQGVKNALGTEAPSGLSYIGDDRGNDVKYAMSDFNDVVVRSNYYLSLLFDPIQAQLFQRKRNYSEGGGISGKLTWISINSKNKLGEHNNEWGTQESDFNNSISTSYDFRDDSILGRTQDILDTLPSNGGEARSHIANVIDQTSRIFKEGDVMMSRGSAVQYVDEYGKETGAEYCRVWTKDRSYLNYSDTMKRQQNIRKFDDSVLDRSWNLNIAPNSNGKLDDFGGSTNIQNGPNGFYAKKYMLSIENLAWKTSNTPGFTVQDLPYCERGPNGGRIMWFPPYDLKVSEQNNAKWESNTFLGRPEPIYTYQSTERSGQVSFKVVVDHPSVLNLLIKDLSDEEAENYINSFFAGCEEMDFYDLITTYSTITPDDAELIIDSLNQKTDTESILKIKSEIIGDVIRKQPLVNKDSTEEINSGFIDLNFANDWPKPLGSDYKSIKYSDVNDLKIGDDVWVQETKDNLTGALNEILSGVTTYNTSNAKRNKKTLFGYEDIPTGETTTKITEQLAELDKQIEQSRNGYTNLGTNIETLIDNINKGNISSNIDINLYSTCSANADNGYNYKLSIRRTYSVLYEILDRIKKNNVNVESILNSKFNFEENQNIKPSNTANKKFEVSLKELGYDESENKITFNTFNGGEEAVSDDVNKICGKQNFVKLTNSQFDLRISAPVTFSCRQTKLKIIYNTTPKQDPQTPPPDPNLMTSIVSVEQNTTTRNRPSVDKLKKIIMKTLSECYYFQKLEETDPVVFTSLKDKLKYFHPGFHSTTPEGLNSRLTFLQQCIRPGDTIPIKGISDSSDLNARNTSFGPPPICVLRVGDFYHSKIVIRDINITFDETTWDLNPEGIGVQPMIANVSLQISYIGGQGLSKPVERLQNALSSNFYANTEMYDDKSINTALTISGQTREEFTKNFLEDLNKKQNKTEKSTNNSNGSQPETGYIGSGTSSLRYDETLLTEIYQTTEDYFTNYESTYNKIVKEYGPSISTIILHPNYRTVTEYDYVDGDNVTNTLSLFGEYPKGRQFSNYINLLETEMLKTLLTTNICQIMSFDNVLTVPKQNRTNEILQNYFKVYIKNKISELSTSGTINNLLEVRNKLIKNLDNLNFVVKYEGDYTINGTEVTKATLSGFTRDLLFVEYENCINNITDNDSKLYEDLDTTINFNRPTITSNVLSELLSVLLKETDWDNLELELKNRDQVIYDTNTLNKLERKFNKFISTPIKDKKFKFKKLKNRKANKEISYSFTTSSETNETIKQELTRLKTPNSVPIEGDKLNYYKP